MQTVFSYKELHFVSNNRLSLLAGTHPSRVIMVAVYAEHRNGNVQVFILIVNPGEPTTHKHKWININWTVICFKFCRKWLDKHSRTDWVVLKFTVWSLRMLKCMGESPIQYCLSMVMQLWRHRRDGLLSWNKSPPSRMKSTFKPKRVDI